MRYKGYAATYAGELQEVNKENYYINGTCKEEFEENEYTDSNVDFRSRNLYAVASGVKSDEAGAELAYIAMDVLKGFFGANFKAENNTYFNYANSAINSHVFDKTGEHFEIDTSVLYIENDEATVYNIGDAPVYFYRKGKMKKLTGTAPTSVTFEKSFFDTSGNFHTEIVEKETIPYMGYLATDSETAPYISESIKLSGSSYFVLCSRALSDVLGEDGMAKILENKEIKVKNKALEMVKKAVAIDPDSNYTAEVVVVNSGLAVPESEMRNMLLWVTAAVVCGLIAVFSSFILGHVASFIDGCKDAIVDYFSGEEENKEEFHWEPKAPAENENQDSVDEATGEGQTAEETDENSDVDEITEDESNQETETNSVPQQSGGNSGNSSGTSGWTPSPQTPVTSEPEVQPEPETQQQPEQDSTPENTEESNEEPEEDSTVSMGEHELGIDFN